jgi:FtsZ-binding cell division protein ZapB
MACEHALLIEPIAQVVYTNKRPYCNLFSLLVVALCVISFIRFVTHIKAFVYELNTEIANLKDDNQRLANKLEAMNISELNMEIANLKDDNQRIANKVEAMNISELRDGLDEVKDDNLRLANKLEFKLEALAISELKMEVTELKELKTRFARHYHIQHTAHSTRPTSRTVENGNGEGVPNIWTGY